MRLLSGLSLAVLMALVSSACSSQDEFVRSCDEEQLYQRAEAHDKLRVPEDLDELDELREMPLPEAAPAAPRPPGSPCLDLPPAINTSSSADESSDEG